MKTSTRTWMDSLRCQKSKINTRICTLNRMCTLTQSRIKVKLSALQMKTIKPLTVKLLTTRTLKRKMETCKHLRWGKTPQVLVNILMAIRRNKKLNSSLQRRLSIQPTSMVSSMSASRRSSLMRRWRMPDSLDSHLTQPIHSLTLHLPRKDSQISQGHRITLAKFSSQASSQHHHPTTSISM